MVTYTHFNLRLYFFGFTARQDLYVTRHLFSGTGLPRPQLDVTRYQLITTWNNKLY